MPDWLGELSQTGVVSFFLYLVLTKHGEKLEAIQISLAAIAAELEKRNGKGK